MAEHILRWKKPQLLAGGGRRKKTLRPSLDRPSRHHQAFHHRHLSNRSPPWGTGLPIFRFFLQCRRFAEYFLCSARGCRRLFRFAEDESGTLPYSLLSEEADTASNPQRSAEPTSSLQLDSHEETSQHPFGRPTPTPPPRNVFPTPAPTPAPTLAPGDAPWR